MYSAPYLSSFFSFIGVYQYEILFPGIGEPVIASFHVPELGSKIETVVVDSQEQAYPTLSKSDEMLVTVTVNANTKSNLFNYFYLWEAAKYDATRTYLQIPATYTRQVIVNLLDEGGSVFTSYTIPCFVESVNILDLDYKNRQSPQALLVRLRLRGKILRK